MNEIGRGKNGFAIQNIILFQIKIGYLCTKTFVSYNFFVICARF
jgi:hypothetical protein